MFVLFVQRYGTTSELRRILFMEIGRDYDCLDPICPDAFATTRREMMEEIRNGVPFIEMMRKRRDLIEIVEPPYDDVILRKSAEIYLHKHEVFITENEVRPSAHPPVVDEKSKTEEKKQTIEVEC